jgi:transcriptional regulator with XRE-family HTH domain
MDDILLKVEWGEKMLSKTLTEGLDKYAIGEKLRYLRLKKKIGLVELGQHSGLSPAMISKIERGKLYPTLPTLLRLALVFSVGLDYFFSRREEPTFEIVRKEERIRFPDDPERKPEEAVYHFESLDYKATERAMTAYLVEFQSLPEEEKGERFHLHDGLEFIYVLSGLLDLYYDKDQVSQLRAGDSVYFDSSVPHTYARANGEKCEAIVVTVP